jgi:hypothetical protein
LAQEERLQVRLVVADYSEIVKQLRLECFFNDELADDKLVEFKAK